MITTKKTANSELQPTNKGNRPDVAFPSESELFSSLTTSAFEFLEMAIDGLQASPKFSTIHFAIAIELFLKARLMKEHWSLLLDKPDEADKAKFFKGDARTVTPDQALKRLNKIADVSIPQDFSNVFMKIANHRNKMVHFAHAGEMNEQGREEIVSEQLEGWMAIRGLLEKWSVFDKYSAKILDINRKMDSYRGFLQKKFETKETEITAHEEAGLHVNQCPRCQFQSLKVEKAEHLIASASCIVCAYKGTEITLICNDCSNKIRRNDYDEGPINCFRCKASISIDDIEEQLNTAELITSDNYFSYIPINCPKCLSMKTVVQHHNMYVCIECFATDNDYDICTHCSEGQLGRVSKHSSSFFCEFCDRSTVI